jgi:hypothetical protein
MRTGGACGAAVDAADVAGAAGTLGVVGTAGVLGEVGAAGAVGATGAEETAGEAGFTVADSHPVNESAVSDRRTPNDSCLKVLEICIGSFLIRSVCETCVH